NWFRIGLIFCTPFGWYNNSDLQHRHAPKIVHLNTAFTDDHDLTPRPPLIMFLDASAFEGPHQPKGVQKMRPILNQFHLLGCLLAA
ncbi:hypothetical protein ACFL02_04240, partial [Planctomycetota bacterium]